MGEGLKRAVAAAKATQRPKGPPPVNQNKPVSKTISAKMVSIVLESDGEKMTRREVKVVGDVEVKGFAERLADLLEVDLLGKPKSPTPPPPPPRPPLGEYASTKR